MPKRKASKRRVLKSRRKSTPTFNEFFKIFDEVLPESTVSMDYQRGKSNHKTVNFSGEKDIEQTFNIIESLDYGKFDSYFKGRRPRMIAVVFETKDSDGNSNFFTDMTYELHGQTFVDSNRKGLKELATKALEKMSNEFEQGTGTVKDLELLQKLSGEKTYSDLLDDENEYSQKLDPAELVSMTFKFFYR